MNETVSAMNYVRSSRDCPFPAEPLQEMMRLWVVAVVVAVAACSGGDTPDDATEQRSDDYEVRSSETDATSCLKEIVAEVTFWKSTSWGVQIYCDGDLVDLEGLKPGESESVEDIGPDSCDEPGVFTFSYEFNYEGGACEYCSSSDDKSFCVPLTSSCEKQILELTASGSEEEGVQPMFTCPWEDVIEQGDALN
jgi:hypothetical protein